MRKHKSREEWEAELPLTSYLLPLTSFCLGVLLLLIVAGITYSGWHRVRTRVLLAEKHHFSIASVDVTKTPPWVPETIVNDVIAEFNIGRVPQETLIDQVLLKELAGVFGAYHWVESVDRIRASYPATVTIDLTYRTPVCMVLLPNMAGSYAVDRHGFHLPSDYFTNSEVDVNRYIKVLGVDSMPMGNIGDKWDNPIVEQAAALANHLNPDNSILFIVSIRVETTGTNQYNKKRLFYLKTLRNTEIVWGEMPLTADDARKKRLLQLVHQYDSLDKVPLGANKIIDVR